MKFQCDSCSAQYFIADEKVGDRGVKVKCKRCAHVIVVRPGDLVASGADEPNQEDDDKTNVAAMAPMPPETPPEFDQSEPGGSERVESTMVTPPPERPGAETQVDAGEEDPLAGILADGDSGGVNDSEDLGLDDPALDDLVASATGQDEDLNLGLNDEDEDEDEDDEDEAESDEDEDFGAAADAAALAALAEDADQGDNDFSGADADDGGAAEEDALAALAGLEATDENDEAPGDEAPGDDAAWSTHTDQTEKPEAWGATDADGGRSPDDEDPNAEFGGMTAVNPTFGDGSPQADQEDDGAHDLPPSEDQAAGGEGEATGGEAERSSLIDDGDQAPAPRDSTEVLDADHLRFLRQKASTASIPGAEPAEEEEEGGEFDPSNFGEMSGSGESATEPSFEDAPEGEDEGWYVAIEEEEVGPLNRHELADRIREGDVKADNLVWAEGMDDWEPADDVAIIRRLIKEVHGQPAPGPFDSALDMPRTPAAEIPEFGGGFGGADLPPSPFGDDDQGDDPFGAVGDLDSSDPSWRPHGLTEVYQAANLAEARAGDVAAPPEPVSASPSLDDSPAGEDEPLWSPGAASDLASLVNNEISSLNSPPPASDDDMPSLAGYEDDSGILSEGGAAAGLSAFSGGGPATLPPVAPAPEGFGTTPGMPAVNPAPGAGAMATGYGPPMGAMAFAPETEEKKSKTAMYAMFGGIGVGVLLLLIMLVVLVVKLAVPGTQPATAAAVPPPGGTELAAANAGGNPASPPPTTPPVKADPPPGGKADPAAAAAATDDKKDDEKADEKADDAPKEEVKAKAKAASTASKRKSGGKKKASTTKSPAKKKSTRPGCDPARKRRSAPRWTFWWSLKKASRKSRNVDPATA
jgi:predicted Zn finger-like uncharacterized protein